MRIYDIIHKAPYAHVHAHKIQIPENLGSEVTNPRLAGTEARREGREEVRVMEQWTAWRGSGTRKGREEMRVPVSVQ